MKRVLDTVQKDAAEAADSDKFYKRLNKNQNKFNTIAQYLERGMIKDFQPEERNDWNIIETLIIINQPIFQF